MENLKFKYKCHFCGDEVKMNTKDIIDFIGTRYNEPEADMLEDFFGGIGMMYNLCPKCASEEGFEVEEFQGY